MNLTTGSCGATVSGGIVSAQEVFAEYYEANREKFKGFEERLGRKKGLADLDEKKCTSSTPPC